MATRAFHPTLPHPRCYGRAGGRAVGQPREVREQQSDSEMLRNGACSQPPQPQGNQGSWRTETQQRTKRTRVVRQCCHQEGCSNSHHIRQLLEGTDSDQHLSKPTQSPSTFLLHFCLNPRIPIFSSPTAPSYLMFPSSSDNTSCPDERKGPLCQKDRQTDLKKKKNKKAEVGRRNYQRW